MEYSTKEPTRLMSMKRITLNCRPLTYRKTFNMVPSSKVKNQQHFIFDQTDRHTDRPVDRYLICKITSRNKKK